MILKTHSGVRRPGIFTVLVTRCTSATQPAHQSNVTKRLADEFKHVSRTALKGAMVGQRGAAFHAVAMARPGQLGFLTSNLFWSWKGHAIRALNNRCDGIDTSNFLELSLAERLIYLKYYLESHGAFLVSIARALVARSHLTETDLVQTELLEKILQKIWQDYLDISTNLREQVELRQRLKRHEYDQSTRRHKMYPILIPLEDVGLVDRTFIDGKEVFFPTVNDGRMPLKALIEAFPTIEEMERSIRREEHSSILATALVPDHRWYSYQENSELLWRMVIETYRDLNLNGAVLSPINAITDVCFARMLSEQRILLGRSAIDRILVELQTRFPRAVRFHVDLMGRPAFLLLDDELVAELLVT